METPSNTSSVRQTLLARVFAFLLAPILALLSQATTIKTNFTTYHRAGISESVVVDMIIGFLLVAILFPIAQNQVVGATTTSWNSSVVTMFEVLLPILVIVAIVYHFIK